MKGRARRGVKALRPLDPASAGGLAAGTGLAPLLKHGFRNLERFVAPTQRSACLCDLLGTERRTMRLFGTLPARRAKANDGTAGDQRRPVIASGLFDCSSDRFGIVAVDPAGRPPGGLEPGQLVIRTG